jgi:hypothetical protein
MRCAVVCLALCACESSVLLADPGGFGGFGGFGGSGGSTGGCGTCLGCCSGSFCVNGNSPLSCGANGVQCQSCAGNESCVAGSCVRCGPSNCPGCCEDVTGTCEIGDTDFYCGHGGGACQFCGASTSCSGGLCR